MIEPKNNRAMQPNTIRQVEFIEIDGFDGDGKSVNYWPRVMPSPPRLAAYIRWPDRTSARPRSARLPNT